MAGSMISFSSIPIVPPSPECGFSPRTAIFGLSMEKSSFRQLFICFTWSIILCFVIVSATFASGIWCVETATFKSSVTKNINPLAANFFSKYSVCPVYGKPCFIISSLLIGAVTSTSISPFIRAFVAASSESIASLVDSSVGVPNFTSISSLRRLTMFICPSTASEAWRI